MPLALRKVFVVPTLAGLHDTDAVALLGSAQRRNAPAEARADDQHVVVEARHEVPPRVVAMSASNVRGSRCLVAPVVTLVSSRVRQRTHTGLTAALTDTSCPQARSTRSPTARTAQPADVDPRTPRSFPNSSAPATRENRMVERGTVCSPVAEPVTGTRGPRSDQ